MGRAANYSGLANRSHLVSFKGSISNSVLCLLMTGRASPYLHNGVQYRGDEDNAVIKLMMVNKNIRTIHSFFLNAGCCGNGSVNSFTTRSSSLDGQRGKDTSC